MMWTTYTLTHGRELNLPDEYAKALESCEGSNTFVYVEDDVICAMGMLIYITDEVVELTLQMYVEPLYKITFARRCKAFATVLRQGLDASRLQANAASLALTHRRFIRMLGLTEEGTLKGFGGKGIDHTIYGVAL